ncbi:MAG: histone deacetylase [Aggregatilineales bacterium]
MTTVYVTHERYVDHDMHGHPEHAGRIKAIWAELKTSGLADRMNRLLPSSITDEQILSVHTAKYLEVFKLIEHQDGVYGLDSDTYALPESPEIARLAAGGVISAIDAVMNGDADNGLAVVRPPGHHAVPMRGMGFCLLGNVAIGAKHAQKEHGLKRVMIVDYDVHHGNGTQDMFYEDDTVLFISTHQSPFYPGSGKLHETGKGHGAGYTINIPLEGGHGDNNYAQIYEDIIWKAARRFKPELILVSAGFDAHWVDPLASMKLTLTGYDHITRELITMANELCGGKIVFTLEGGYDLDALKYGVANVARALLNDDNIVDPLGSKSQKEPDVRQLIKMIQGIHDL